MDKFDLDRQDFLHTILDSLLKMVTLRQNLTNFTCTSCSQCHLTAQSPEYLIMVAQIKSELEDLLGVARDFLADCPLFCDCLLKLAAPMTDVIQLMECLFDTYPYAYNVGVSDEKDAIEFFDAVYKDAYKLNMVFIHILRECQQGHYLFPHYHYGPKKCHSCLRQQQQQQSLGSENNTSSNSSSSLDHCSGD
jgi:hypothetical protein